MQGTTARDETSQIQKRSTVLLSKIKQLHVQDAVLQTILAPTTRISFNKLFQKRDDRIAELEKKLEKKSTKIYKLCQELGNANADYSAMKEARDKSQLWLILILVALIAIGILYFLRVELVLPVSMV